MREIKFRGFGKDDKCKRWIYGNLLDEKLVGIVAIQDENCHVWEVDPKSVGQYTGLSDINGKDIYEGDIVQFPKPHYFLCPEPILTASVAYEYGQFLIIYHGLARFTIFNIINNVTVIGNVHDNPELLTDVKD